MKKKKSITAAEYVDGLKKAYAEYGGKQLCENLETVAHGASDEDIDALLKIYPDAPASLVELLRIIDGTYYRDYEQGTLTAPVFGSDVDEGEYGYYLLSARQMVESHENRAWEYLADIIDRKYDRDEIYVGERIADDSSKICWLHFADCINNGGTSQLFIDFSPSDEGSKGQIVRFVHDPDDLDAIATDFDHFMECIASDDYAFVNEDTIEDYGDGL